MEVAAAGGGNCGKLTPISRDKVRHVLPFCRGGIMEEVSQQNFEGGVL
jgi:hypothetical protein